LGAVGRSGGVLGCRRGARGLKETQLDLRRVCRHFFFLWTETGRATPPTAVWTATAVVAGPSRGASDFVPRRGSGHLAPPAWWHGGCNFFLLHMGGPTDVRRHTAPSTGSSGCTTGRRSSVRATVAPQPLLYRCACSPSLVASTWRAQNCRRDCPGLNTCL